ncbi:MAG TPA: hypothetical protein VK745_27360 [Polyangiaceae bacterium]|nr:hypothetical protein [Polyangiaceae bacterium]
MSLGKLSALTLAIPLALLAGCEPRVTNIAEQDAGVGVYLEAEDGALSGGFLIGDDPTASAGHFIYVNAGATFDTAPGGSANARYQLAVKSDGTYLIWGRIHSPTYAENRFWFQLDGGAWTLWRISTGDIWFWDAFHDNTDYGDPIPFALSAGSHELVIANAVDVVGLDRLYFAPVGSMPVGNDTICNPPHSIAVDGGCTPSCGSLGGLCGANPCDGTSTSTPTYDCHPTCCVPPADAAAAQ